MNRSTTSLAAACERVPHARGDEPEKLQYVQNVRKIDNGNTDPETYNRLYEGIDKEGTVTVKDLNEAMAAGQISKSSYIGLSKKLNSQTSEVIQNRYKMISESIAPDNKEQNRNFMVALKQEALAKSITDPNELQKLAEQMKAVATTGARGFWNVISLGAMKTEKEKPYFEIARMAQSNPDIMRAVGGRAESAIALGRRIGGVEKLVAGTPESAAIMELLSAGVKPERIDKKTVEAAMAQLRGK